MTKTGESWVSVTEKGFFYALGLFFALALKHHYSQADSDDLAWILYPTAALVEALTGISFEKEARAGFISKGHGIIIAPACAGVNFLIIAFSTLYFTNIARLMGTARRALWFALAAGIGYLVTLGVNALRITVAVVLYKADIYGGWITPDRVHRIEGTLVYCICLLVLHMGGEQIAGWLNRCELERTTAPALKTHGLTPRLLTCAVPFLWYSFITVGVPVLNQAYGHSGPRFVEHGVLVLLVCLVVFVLFFLIRMGCYKMSLAVRKLSADLHDGAANNM